MHYGWLMLDRVLIVLILRFQRKGIGQTVFGVEGTAKGIIVNDYISVILLVIVVALVGSGVVVVYCCSDSIVAIASLIPFIFIHWHKLLSLLLLLRLLKFLLPTTSSHTPISFRLVQ